MSVWPQAKYTRTFPLGPIMPLPVRRPTVAAPRPRSPHRPAGADRWRARSRPVTPSPRSGGSHVAAVPMSVQYRAPRGQPALPAETSAAPARSGPAVPRAAPAASGRAAAGGCHAVGRPSRTLRSPRGLRQHRQLLLKRPVPPTLNPGDDLHRAPRFVTNVAINCEVRCETCALTRRRARRGSPDAHQQNDRT